MDGKDAPASSKTLTEGSHIHSPSNQQSLPPSAVDDSTTESKRSVEESAADVIGKKAGESCSQNVVGAMADEVGIPPFPAPSPKRSRSLTNVSRAAISGKSQSPDKPRDAIPFSGWIKETEVLSASDTPMDALALRESLTSSSTRHASTKSQSPVTPGWLAERGPKVVAGSQGSHAMEPGSSRGGDENADMEVEVLREAIQAERARADQARQNHEALLELMRMAEGILAQHTGEGVSRVAAIHEAANRLVSSELLLHLPLSEARMLTNLQAEIKKQADEVLGALTTMTSVTRANQTPPGRKPREARDPAPPGGSQPKE